MFPDAYNTSDVKPLILNDVSQSTASSSANILKSLSNCETLGVFDLDRFYNDKQRIEHLRLLLKEFDPDYDQIPISNENIDWWSYLHLSFLGFAGTVCSICSGFDGSVSILTLFIGIPSWTVFLVGFALSLVLVVLFYGLDFIEISDNLNVRLHQSNQSVEQAVTQADLVELFINKIKERLCLIKASIVSPDSNVISQGADEISKMESLLKMLLVRQDDLSLMRKEYRKEIERTYVRLLKAFANILIGLLFFNAGFFTGQVLSVVIFSAFIAAGISATAWPVLLISIFVGLASLNLYWYKDRAIVERLACRWVGLDEDKINRLPDDDFIGKQKTELETLLSETKFINDSRLLSGQSMFREENSLGVPTASNTHVFDA